MFYYVQNDIEPNIPPLVIGLVWTYFIVKIKKLSTDSLNLQCPLLYSFNKTIFEYNINVVLLIALKYASTGNWNKVDIHV